MEKRGVERWVPALFVPPVGALLSLAIIRSPAGQDFFSGLLFVPLYFLVWFLSLCALGLAVWMLRLLPQGRHKWLTLLSLPPNLLTFAYPIYFMVKFL